MEPEFELAVTGIEIPDSNAILIKVIEALNRGNKRINIINGYSVNTNSMVKISMGPVLGEITTNKAIMLLEVDEPGNDVIPIFANIYKEDEKDHTVQQLHKNLPARRPFVFEIENLEPNTEYTVIINGVSKYNATHRFARFTTKSENIVNFRMLALSCDRPSRLLLGQENPWEHMLSRGLSKGRQKVNTVLHLGDQVYPDDEDIEDADRIFNKIYDDLKASKKILMMQRGREIWRNKYRKVFSSPYKSKLMASVSNLMIWSDNDVANDFTVMKNEDKTQKYHPNFLQCGIRTYREYQRRLWDSSCKLDYGKNDEVQEWHSHVYGPIGIFMFDLRGNRIDGGGIQASENSILSKKQWTDFESFIANPDLRVIVLCSETPFVGDEPQVCKKQVEEDSHLEFLKDHWPYNEDELIRLLDRCFLWQFEGQKIERRREVLMLGGDIHCGVTSLIRDIETGMTITHITTSPVTNHVCKYFPPTSGDISPRYSFSHLPLGRQFRNYADIRINIEDNEVFVQAKLVPITTDIFKNMAWQNGANSRESVQID